MNIFARGNDEGITLGDIMRELTYKVPYERLTKLSRSMARRVFPARLRWISWLVLAAYLFTLLMFITHEEAVSRFMAMIGIPSGMLPYGMILLMLFSLVAFFLCVRLTKKSQARYLKQRANFDLVARLVQDGNGIRIGTETIEYYLKWAGISQLLVEPDGVVLSHGTLFWLIPDAAFASPAERLGFIRDVFGRLSDAARAISEDEVAPLLQRQDGAKVA